MSLLVMFLDNNCLIAFKCSNSDLNKHIFGIKDHINTIFRLQKNSRIIEQPIRSLFHNTYLYIIATIILHCIATVSHRNVLECESLTALMYNSNTNRALINFNHKLARNLRNAYGRPDVGLQKNWIQTLNISSAILGYNYF